MKQWCASMGDSDLRRQASNAGRRAWLLHVRDALGPQFTLHETKDAWVLSSLEPNVVAAAADFMLTTRGRITRLLGGLAGPQVEPSILIVFGDEESYYRYIAAHDSSEGESAMSSGMFIDAGCPHFVTVRADLTLIEPIIVHELTHGALSHLAIPTWLNEGIAVNAEHQLTGAPRYARISPAMHQAFWNEDEIQEFWSGGLFRRPDDGAALSYDLARIMVENMAQQWSAFEAFVLYASRDDAGAQAARDHLGIDQGAYVCALLGLEPSMAWSPRTFSVV
jgi:hypothetical protein